MKTISKFCFMFLLVMCGVLTLACKEKVTITINADALKLEMIEGETQKVSYEISSGTAETIFVSSDTNVISVDENGNINALSVGSAKITITVKVGKEEKTEEVTIKVVAREYEVTYNLDGGTLPSGAKTKFTLHETLTLPTPTKAGYTFLGWSLTAGGTTYITTTQGRTSDFTVYANWSKIIVNHTISYDLDGGTCADLVESYVEGENVTLPTPTKEGFTFLGWFEGETKVEAITNGVKDYTLKAKWEIITYAITYDLDGANIKDDELITSYNHGANVTLPTPIKEGFTFLGWYEGETKVEAITNGTKAYALKAAWEKITYTVTYDLDGGTCTGLVESYEYGGSVTLPTPTKEKFSFLGWYEGETKVESITNGAKNYDLVAKWLGDLYTITYVLNGGADASPINSYNYGEDKDLSIPVLYTFKGWSTTENGENIVTNVNELEGNVTLYAIWADNRLPVGDIAHKTIADALALANDGDTIVLLEGTFAGCEINKSVTILGNNAYINPNTMTRKGESFITGDLVIAADNVTINGIDLTEKGRITAVTNKNVENIKISYVRVVNSTLNPTSADSLTAPFTFASAGFVIKNVSVDKCRIEALTSGRPMIMYVVDVENLTITNSHFLGGYYNYNDGIKVDNTGTFGVRGDVTISGNYFKDYAQYTIWLRKYGAGNYVIENNDFEHIGQTVASHAAFNMISSVVGAEETLNVSMKYNHINNGLILFRLDTATLQATKTTINLNYNLLTNCSTAEFYVKNENAGLPVNAEYNYWGETINATKFKNVTSYANHYESADAVLKQSEVENLTYNLSLDLNEGSWEQKKYTRDEIVEMLLVDLTAYYGTQATKDNVHTISENTSKTMYGFFDDATYATKWTWLKTYLLYCRQNDPTQSSGYSYLTDNNNSYWRYEVWAFLNCAPRETWPYSANYSLEVFLEHFETVVPTKDAQDVPTTYKFAEEMQLPIPVRDGYEFAGWVDENGEDYTMIYITTKGDLKLYARWDEAVRATEFAVTNIPEIGILRFATLQLEWAFTPLNAYNQTVAFRSSDETIFTVTNKGLITAIAEGEATLYVTCDGYPQLNKEYKIKVYIPGNIDFEIDGSSIIGAGEKVVIKTVFEGNVTGEIEWKSSNEAIATVDSNGEVTTIRAGRVTISAQLKGNDSVSTSIELTVIDGNSMSEVQQYLASIMNATSLSTTAVTYANSVGYYYAINRGASLFLFEDLNINKEYMRENTADLSTVAYITVHDTGNMNKTADAEANIKYFQTATTSIHFTTGNDGIFQGVDLTKKAAHAGDSMNRAYALDKTDVPVTEGTPVITMVNGNFAINGTVTNLRPYSDTAGTEFVTTNYTTSQITYSGIRCVAGDDGFYYLGKTYFNTDYKLISNFGGNASSIGIESCVNAGSDYYLTMQRTAKLIASLLEQFDLTVDDVKMHNFFSGKNCAQLMKNNSRYELNYQLDKYAYEETLWGELLELIVIESKMLEFSKDYTFSFVSSDTTLVDNTGRIVGHKDVPTNVKYVITITSKTTGESSTLNGSILVPSIYSLDNIISN